MGSKSNYLEQKVLDYVFNGSAFSTPATWAALFTTTPGEDGTGGVEVSTSGTAYARQRVYANTGGSPDWKMAVTEGGGGYLVDNDDDITFPQATASWGTVVGFALYDSATTGNMLYYGVLDASKDVGNGDTFKFAVGDLNIIEK